MPGKSLYSARSRCHIHEINGCQIWHKHVSYIIPSPWLLEIGRDGGKFADVEVKPQGNKTKQTYYSLNSWPESGPPWKLSIFTLKSSVNPSLGPFSPPLLCWIFLTLNLRETPLPLWASVDHLLNGTQKISCQPMTATNDWLYQGERNDIYRNRRGTFSILKEKEEN